MYCFSKTHNMNAER